MAMYKAQIQKVEGKTTKPRKRKPSKAVLEMNPTQDVYGALLQAFDRFNADLFEGRLQRPVFTLARKPGMYGYFIPAKYNKAGAKITAPEMCINPDYVRKRVKTPSGLKEILQTLAHEMAHQARHEIDGDVVSNGYHDKKWGDIMETIGLMPSHNGKPGGKKTGRQMMDYPIKGGKFAATVKDMLKGGYKIKWATKPPKPVTVSAPVMVTLPGMAAPVAAKPSGTRVKFSCGCGCNLWGKPTLQVACIVHNKIFVPV